MKHYFIYILRCNDGSFYTGVCNDIERRFAEHEAGMDESCYTYSRRPLKLVYAEESRDVNEILSREKQIKGWSRAKKEALAKGDFKKLVELSGNRVSKKPAIVHPSTGSG